MQGRAHRVATLIRQEIAKLLLKGLKDPRIGFVSVMDVRMSPDLRYANVYVSLYGSEKERKSSLIALQNSAGWIRREIGKFLKLRFTPEVRFFPDDTLDEVYHLEDTFQKIHEEQRTMPMNPISLHDVVEEFRTVKTILITSHINPDGDAVGSMLALAYLARALGVTAIHLVLADPVPAVYRSLPGAASIRAKGEEKPKVDLIVIIDVARFDRIGAVAEWIDPLDKVLILDHHLEKEPQGTIGHIDPAYAAAGELVADLFQAADIVPSREAAHCAYVAQITDTGCYRFSSTNARSHIIAARLVETGIDVAAICGEVFDTMPRAKFHLLRSVMDRTVFLLDGRVAWSCVTQADLDEHAGSREDLNGLVNYVRNVEGVEVGLLFTSVEPDVTKVSVRSAKTFNAAHFLQPYGGGGHAAAAGVTLQMDLETAQTALIAALETELGSTS
ncbi:MAG: 30S ribosome-binding factor RbfA [Candidatus Hydrogenedentes bacterium]|nr:30S ribosome-binding factor RbfA [Candidatus Hydrogenedentota bacterium]